jgi:hypothetical protein
LDNIQVPFLISSGEDLAKEKLENLSKANKKASYRVIAGERNMARQGLFYLFPIFCKEISLAS